MATQEAATDDWRKDPLLAAHYVLWFMEGHPKAVRPGSFAEALVRAMSLADRSNLQLLAQGFPALAEAVDKYKNSPTGRDELITRVA